jgi:dienelactone hydrolase
MNRRTLQWMPALVSAWTLHAAGAAAEQPHCFGMVCCPPGQALHGLHLTSTSLLCRPAPQGSEDCFVDYATQRNGMHSCPKGTYIRGVHAESNLLTCCFDRERGFSLLGTEIVDSGTQESGMHACPNRGLLTGIRTDQNLFSCAVPQQGAPVADPVRIRLDPERPRTHRDLNPDAVWKRAVRNWLRRILDLPLSGPPPAPRVTVGREETVDNGFVKVTRRRIRYASATDGATVQAYLLLPEGYPNHGPYDAAIVTHGHYDSKDATAIDWRNPHHAAALYLAQNGFVALAPDTRSLGEFKPISLPFGSVSAAEYHREYVAVNRPHWNKISNELWGLGIVPQKYVLDAATGLSVLLAQPALNKARVFSFGLSVGGWQALFLGATDERIKGSVIAATFLTLACMNDPGISGESPCKCQTVPPLWWRPHWPQPLLDFPDLARLVDGPVFATYGKSDSLYNQKGNDGRVCRETAQAAMAGVPGWSFAEIDDMTHEIENLTSLDRLIGRPTTAERHKGPRGGPCNGTHCCNGMHCCKAGSALLGAELNRDDFLCQPLGAASDTCRVVGMGVAQRLGIAACPAGQYVRGIDPRTHKLTCCTNPRRALRREAVDTSTMLQTMHACPSASRQQSVMTGIDAVRNRLLCAMP